MNLVLPPYPSTGHKSHQQNQTYINTPPEVQQTYSPWNAVTWPQKMQSWQQDRRNEVTYHLKQQISAARLHTLFFSYPTILSRSELATRALWTIMATRICQPWMSWDNVNEINILPPYPSTGHKSHQQNQTYINTPPEVQQTYSPWNAVTWPQKSESLYSNHH